MSAVSTVGACNLFIYGHTAFNTNVLMHRREFMQQNYNLFMCSFLDLAEFSSAELRTLLREFEQNCSTLSETLIKELRFKDELLREKQARDDFISLLLSISRKQTHKEAAKPSRRKRILSHMLGNVENSDNKVMP